MAAVFVSLRRLLTVEKWDDLEYIRQLPSDVARQNEHQ